VKILCLIYDKRRNFFSKSQYIKDNLKVLSPLRKNCFFFLIKSTKFLKHFDLLRRVCQRCRWFNISFFTLLCFYPFSFIGFSVIHMLVNAEFVLGSFSLLSIFLLFDFFYSKEQKNTIIQMHARCLCKCKSFFGEKQWSVNITSKRNQHKVRWHRSNEQKHIYMFL